MQGTPRYSVIVVLGTRPEAIKLIPVIRELRASEYFTPFVVATGQHADLVRDVLAKAGVTPDVELQLDRADGSLNELVVQIMKGFDEEIREVFGARSTPELDVERARAGFVPVGVIVHGDTSSAFAAALAAFHLKIPVLHVEAGLRAGRSNMTPFPEELNRRLISEIAVMHFAPTAAAAENLIREGVPSSQVFVTGNTGVDAIKWAAALDVTSDSDDLEAVLASKRRIVAITAHRRENWNGGLHRIGRAVQQLADVFPEVQFVAPLHPNPIVQNELGTMLLGRSNILTIPSLAYWSFARLLARAELVLTDSGGIQEEAPSLGTPVFVARDSTERMEGVDAGCIELVGSDTDRIVAAISRVLNDPVAHHRMVASGNPYGDGRAAERICGALAHISDADAPPPHPFGPGYDRRMVLAAGGLDASAIEHVPIDDLLLGVTATGPATAIATTDRSTD
ncbi:MAG: UDP-N-acetylglucosamine 2-epimerase (non-hydrolyzing) [Gaiellales bacterium]